MNRQRPIECPQCGQSGAERPGIAIEEFETLDAVFVGDQLVPNPQRLRCRTCGHTWAIPRGSVEVRRS